MKPDKSKIITCLLKSFSFVPYAVRKSFFLSLAYLFYLSSPRYRFIALYGLCRAFPENDLWKNKRILKGVYRNFATVAAEFFHIPFLTAENIGQLVELEGYDNYLRAKGENRGIIIYGAHFGNWELQIASLALLLEPIAIVYRPLDNPFLEELMCHARTAQGNKLIKKKGAMKHIASILKQNGIVGIMIDQNMDWRGGVFVDFFGRPACTTNSIASLALSMNTQVMPSFLVRKPTGKYSLVIQPALEIIRTGNEEEDIIINTQRFTAVVEEMVRKYPDQWLWLHHRWKTKLCQVGGKA